MANNQDIHALASLALASWKSLETSFLHAAYCQKQALWTLSDFECIFCTQLQMLFSEQASQRALWAAMAHFIAFMAFMAFMLLFIAFIAGAS